MNSDIPKVLHALSGKPLVMHVIESLNSADIDDIFVIIGFKGDQVAAAVNGYASCVWQHEQKGTGHAVMQAEEAFLNFSGFVIVTCGDAPMIKPETFRRLASFSHEKNIGAVVLTMELTEPSGYGRIVKDSSGSFVKIVEEKDSSENEKLIKEVNTGTYLFRSDYLFNGLKEVKTDNAQGEYYLTDALQYALKQV